MGNQLTTKKLHKKEDPAGYAKLASEGILLGYPVKINGQTHRPDNNIGYHASLKEFNKEKDHLHSIHDLAQHLPLNPPDAKNTQIEPVQFQDRNGNDVFVVKLKGNSADKMKEHNGKFAHMGHPSKFEWSPHVSVDRKTWDKIKSSGAKTAHEAGISFGSAELKHGPKTIKTYHHEADTAEPKFPDHSDFTAKVNVPITKSEGSSLIPAPNKDTHKELDLHHGTKSKEPFEHFDMKHHQSGFYPGVYTTSDPEKAKQFGRPTKVKFKGHLFEIKNPKHAEELHQHAGGGGSGHKLVQKLKAVGYHGIKRGDEHIIFDPENAKIQKSENVLGKKPLAKPYESLAQERWAHTPNGEKALGGKAGVHEWDEATKGKKLPERVSKTLEKGEKGDWQKEGYRIKSLPHKEFAQKFPKYSDSNSLLPHHIASPADQVHYAISPQNKIVGHVAVKEHPTHLYPVDSQVNPKHQRKGLATALYSSAEKHHGKKLKHSDNPADHSPDAQKLWAQPNRPFGKSEPLEKGALKNAMLGGAALLASHGAHAASGDLHQYVSGLNKLPGVKVESKFSPYSKNNRHGEGAYKVKVGNYTINGQHNSNGAGSNHKVGMSGPKNPTSQDSQDQRKAQFLKDKLSTTGTQLLEKFESVSVGFMALEKGALKNAGIALGMAGALAGSAPQTDAGNRSPASIQHAQPKSNYDHAKMLRAIASVESSGGKNTNHAAGGGPIHGAEHAYGAYGLMPETIRETIKGHKDLASKHGKALALKGQQLHNYMNDHKGLENTIADRHLSHMEHVLGNNPDNLAYGWLNGIQGTKGALKNKQDIKNHWHVAKVREAYGKEK